MCTAKIDEDVVQDPAAVDAWREEQERKEEARKQKIEDSVMADFLGSPKDNGGASGNAPEHYVGGSPKDNGGASGNAPEHYVGGSATEHEVWQAPGTKGGGWGWGSLIDAVDDAWVDIVDAITEDIPETFEEIKSDGIIDVIGNTYEHHQDWMNDYGGDVLDDLDEIYTDFIERANETKDDVIESVDDRKNEVVEIVNKKKDEIVDGILPDEPPAPTDPFADPDPDPGPGPPGAETTTTEELESTLEETASGVEGQLTGLIRNAQKRGMRSTFLTGDIGKAKTRRNTLLV